MKKEVTYKEPTGYFNADMQQAAEEWDKKHPAYYETQEYHNTDDDTRLDMTDVCTTDGNFFEDMKAAERAILEKIDPDAIPLLDKEERIAQEEYEKELAE